MDFGLKDKIALVTGAARGIGFAEARVLAAEGASFIQAFSRIGLIPDCGGTWLLPRLVGRAKALELQRREDRAALAAALTGKVRPELLEAAVALHFDSKKRVARDEDDGFLSRWSRRKLDVAKEAAAPKPAPPPSRNHGPKPTPWVSSACATAGESGPR